MQAHNSFQISPVQTLTQRPPNILVGRQLWNIDLIAIIDTYKCMQKSSLRIKHYRELNNGLFILEPATDDALLVLKQF